MEVGIHIPHVGPLAEPAFVTTFCQEAEEAGFDGLWAVEHLAVPRTMASAYTLARRSAIVESDDLRATMGLNLETLTTLSVAAAVTSRVRLGTSVAVLPLRNPVLNARQLASIDLYSGGRLMYGAGIGWLREEAEAVGMPWDRRGARADEHIRILRALWGATDEWVSFDGEFQSFTEIDPAPQPERPIPVLVGGHSAVAFDRVARLGDGWIGAMGPERLSEARAALATACGKYGRDPDDLQIVCSIPAPLPMGDPSTTAAGLQRYAEQGVDHVVVSMPAVDPQGAHDWIAHWKGHVLPHLRGEVT